MAAGRGLAIVAVLAALAALAGYFYWRHVWFFRNPPRFPPVTSGFVSPADGTVVYAHKVEAGAPVVVIKEGVSATVRDLLREDLESAKLVIGIFMSPFDIHYNRAPLEGVVGAIKRHGPIGPENHYMTEMHWRSLLDRKPLHAGSMHIVENERMVTRFSGDYLGAPLTWYVVQIGARTVNGIDAYFVTGERVARGTVFGMIRVGSQVDLVVPWREGMEVLVQPGTRVRAGETIVLR